MCWPEGRPLTGPGVCTLHSTGSDFIQRDSLHTTERNPSRPTASLNVQLATTEAGLVRVAMLGQDTAYAGIGHSSCQENTTVVGLDLPIYVLVKK